MEERKGQIVRSLAGHDAGELFWVAETEGDFLLVADGGSRKLSRLKRKRRRHVEFTGQAAAIAGDGQLRRALAVCREELLGVSEHDTPSGQGGNHAWQKTI